MDYQFCLGAVGASIPMTAIFVYLRSASQAYLMLGWAAINFVGIMYYG